MSALILVGLVLVVAAVGGFTIWTMERQRNRLLSADGVEGIVVDKRDSSAHGETRLFAQGTGLGRMTVTPHSYILTVSTPRGDRQLVVGEETFKLYEIGASFP